ncbi:hypothetical protein PG987_011427 [Apiospora arundinis]
MLMGFLTNSIPPVKIMTMRILSVIIPETEMRKPEIAGHGSDLISPLLRLLQSEYCMEALEVLGSIMTMSGSSMDKHHLRMSMTRASSKAVRKEYERTQSLFGIPEESGWAVPIPAKKTDITRANIHAAFYVCQSDAENGTPTEPTPTPEVEFHNDDFPYGYFQVPERSDTMMSDDVRNDGQTGADLVTRLDSLDDFFDDMSQSPPSEGRSSRTITEFSPEGYESTTQLYDEQILPILHQASSNTSFQNGFVDRPPPGGFSPRDVPGSTNTMNPGAFSIAANNQNSMNLMTTTIVRPPLHNRSITSPSAPASYTPQMGDSFTSDDELTEDVFSDGDDAATLGGSGSVGSGGGGSGGGSGSGGHQHAGGASSGASGGSENGNFFLESMIRPVKQATRSHMRRLTGGRSRDAERQRDLFRTQQLGQISSPQVPKVPNSYLVKSPDSPGDML